MSDLICGVVFIVISLICGLVWVNMWNSLLVKLWFMLVMLLKLIFVCLKVFSCEFMWWVVVWEFSVWFLVVSRCSCMWVWLNLMLLFCRF